MIAQTVQGQRGFPKGCHSVLMLEQVNAIRTKLPKATVVRVEDWRVHLSNNPLYVSRIISRWGKRRDTMKR